MGTPIRRVQSAPAPPAATGAGTGDLLSTNNLSDVADVVVARSNLGLEIGVDVEAFGGGGISDGDKGQIVVSSSGTVWTLDTGAAVANLGFTPYNATNPSGYISSITSGNVTGALGYTPTSVTGFTGVQPVAAFKTGLALVKADVGLGSVDNTADSAKSVASAATLTTPRTINGVSFNGSANITVNAVDSTARLASSAVSAYGLTLIDDADAATARTTLGLGTLATQSGTFSGTSSGTNTGDQTTITGNAGSATVLQTARTINGVSFNGSANITINAVDSTARLAASAVSAFGLTLIDDADAATARATIGAQVAGSYLTGNQTITLSGDVAGSGATAITTTLATVNANVGTFGSSTLIPVVTVNAKGLITAISTVTAAGGGGGVSDGDKGDVAISASGTVYTVEGASGLFTPVGGVRATGTVLTRIETTGVSAPTGAAGFGLELYNSGMQVYDRTGSAFGAFAFGALSYAFSVSGATRLTIDGNGITAPNLTSFLAAYRTILDCSGSHTAAKVAGLYGFGHGDPLAITGTGTLNSLDIIYIDSADYPTAGAVAAKLRIRCTLAVNDVAPTGNFTIALHPVTRPATSGGAGLVIYTIGAAVTGSGVTSTAPAADSINNLVGADFALPASGHYVVAVTSTATVAASSHLHFSAALQLHYA